LQSPFNDVYFEIIAPTTAEARDQFLIVDNPSTDQGIIQLKKSLLNGVTTSYTVTCNLFLLLTIYVTITLCVRRGEEHIE